MDALGVAALTAVYGGYANLEEEMARTYAALAFHDVLVEFEPRPAMGLDPGRVEGVRAWEARSSFEAAVRFEGERSPVLARFLSLPEGRLSVVDRLRFEAGSAPVAPGQTAVERAFASHHGLGVGHRLLVEGRNGSLELTVTGVAVSPEYLWPAKSVQEHMPDVLRRWGVFWVSAPTVARIAGGDAGDVNQVAVLAEPGASLPDLLTRLQASAGVPLRRAETRESQASHAVLGMITSALQQMAFVLPLVFLAIVGLSSYVLLTRLVHLQRAHIGLFRALGYSPARVLTHYLTYALIVAGAGAVVGFAAGHGLSAYVTRVFSSYVSLPSVPVRLRGDLFALGLGLSLLFTTLASLLPARQAARLHPAESLRPPAPPTGRARAGSAGHRLRGPYPVRLGARNLLRNPRRTLLTTLGLALAVSILVVPQGVIDSLNAAVDEGLVRVQRADLLVSFRRPVPSAELSQPVSGVARIEPLVQLPTSLFRHGLPLEVTVFGLRPGDDLFRLYDADDRRIAPPPDGLLLSRIFERHGLRVGDEVTLSGERIRVVGFVDGLGATGYVTIDRARGWAGIGDAATQGLVAFAPEADRARATEALAQALPVAATQDTAQALADTRSMLRLYYGFVFLLLGFGLAIAGAIVFNAVTIGVLEERRNLATLRTLGEPMRAVVAVTTTQVVGVAVPGTLLGLLLGTGLTRYFVGVFASDLFVLDLAIAPSTLAAAALGAIGVALVAQVPGLRGIARMDLGQAVRERAA